MLHKVTPYLIFISLLCFGLNSAYSQNIINRKSNQLPFEVLKTNKDTIKIHEIIINDFEFQSPSTFTKKSHPFNTYWLKIDFSDEINNIRTDTIWYLRLPKFEYASLFQMDDNNFIEQKFGRFEHSEKDRSIIYGAGIPFNPKNLINGKYLYIKIKRVVYFENINNWRIGYVSEYKESLTRYYYSNYNLKTLVPYYIFGGICLIMFFLTLAFYIYSQRKEFLYYMLYVLFLLLYLNSEVFKLHELFFGSYGLLSYTFFQVSQVVINFCYILFIIHYLDTKSTYKKLHKALILIAYLLGGIILTDIVFFATKFFVGHIYLLDFERLVMTLFGLAGMIYLTWKSKDKLAYFVVIGSFFYMIGALGLLFLSEARYMIIGSTLEILIFASGLAYKIQGEFREKLRFQSEAIKNKNKALRAQINPHFIFNSLSSIQHFITENNKQGALKYLSKFSRLTRNILESSIESRVVLSDEITMIEDYLALEALRFDNSFSYEIIIEPNVEVDIIEIPMLIIQPFIENAILHGLLNKEGDSKVLTISFRQNLEFLTCIIDDNGIGREASSKKQRLHKNKSRGLEVTSERLKINNLSDNNIQVIDKSDDNGKSLGTTVIIKINL